MPPPPTKPHTVGSRSQFDPEEFLTSWQSGSSDLLPQNDDLRDAVVKTFNLPPKDSYVYRAIAEVTLDQVQHAIGFGGQHGLHGWYVDDEDKPRPPPPSADIAAYTNVFSPNTSTASALRGLASNAKKDSLRAAVAAHLQSQFFLAPADSSLAPLNLPNKRKQPLVNPYYDFWAWSCADFTGKVLRAYQGDYVVVAGTQNHNGFTGFKDETIADWMARERKEFERVAQVPLPSFAGKDEALFVFVRRK
ncbi:putative transcription factor nrm1 whi5 protein [Neofusicoccum parvum UCRNP2]|uniref:Putative transcription factor nrm1 whi5 protein n=1 Tax=Botryosphaeria parva (strain UCR-NP2) TaxID=1287680 RepID=R1G663_BOTPV|nr:putative transcription factor nrm1 whi5 protein [Neofusicoccum parvum UCRNP2]